MAYCFIHVSSNGMLHSGSRLSELSARMEVRTVSVADWQDYLLSDDRLTVKYSNICVGLDKLNPGHPSFYRTPDPYGLQKDLSTVFDTAST